MKQPPFPPDESLRIKDLLSYKILDTESEKDFDDLVELASQLCNCPIASIAFIDNDRQWFKARKNIDDPETPRDIAFCSHTILQDEVMVVNDARTDERFSKNPLVTGKMQIGFYAGAPIYSNTGFKLGTVCVIDNMQKKELSDSQKNGLKIIARQVAKLLELRLKNDLLQKKAEAEIKAEKKFSQLTIKENDNKERHIAFELHENLAQTLAATKLFLDSAESSHELLPFFLEKSKENVSFVLDEVRNLSKLIVPTTFKHIDYSWFICDYGKAFGEKNNITVRFDGSQIINDWGSITGLHLFRIIENQLKIARNQGATEISITIKSGRDITLEITDNSICSRLSEKSLQLQNNITNRVELMNATVNQHQLDRQHILSITIPPEIKTALQ